MLNSVYGYGPYRELPGKDIKIDREDSKSSLNLCNDSYLSTILNMQISPTLTPVLVKSHEISGIYFLSSSHIWNRSERKLPKFFLKNIPEVF